ncbi:FAD binding domain-containing protein [Bradyrhizobium sp. R2.2-H]|uniref:FAD-binding oxidoreductase n=1 Tax=unclassified Bradyrhizobium TaxID=2631580 RepID=UPI0010E31F4A|nr:MULTISPECIES: FAD-binding protein [unclassified Bradyrhizobium]TCU67241.1 FAD binding domain-containing protein [Bradyrhizobium sp. Y-H1]TCU69192.1 FAD binding domain-containing protein [Bradyrhizobium sp. R2.2-H]
MHRQTKGASGKPSAGGGAGAVVRPGSTEDVSNVVRLCHEHGGAAVPKGGNTGIMGGVAPWPTHTGIVLSLGRMNRVLDVDPVGYAMTRQELVQRRRVAKMLRPSVVLSSVVLTVLKPPNRHGD